MVGGLIEFFAMVFGLGALFLLAKERFAPGPCCRAAVTAATD
jgi:hypothetical protein